MQCFNRVYVGFLLLSMSLLSIAQAGEGNREYQPNQGWDDFSKSDKIDAPASNKPAQSKRQALDFLKNGDFTLQTGFVSVRQGANQLVPIKGLIGDQFSVTQNTDQNALLGLGYYLTGSSSPTFRIQYGLDAFYLFPTEVSGNVIQENLFANLSYQYKVTNIPVYAAAKAVLGAENKKFQFVVDAGIGPNFMITSGFGEQPLNDYSLPDTIFGGASSTSFSASLGLGLRVNHLLPQPIECGYRFFYLGNGVLNSVNSQVLDNLDNGSSYAQSLVCSATF